MRDEIVDFTKDGLDFTRKYMRYSAFKKNVCHVEPTSSHNVEDNVDIAERGNRNSEF